MPAGDAITRTLEARRVRGIQVGMAVAALIVVLRVTPWTQHLFFFSLIESYAYDLIHDYSEPLPPGDIVIVEIDDKSLRELGRFQSWHRDKYAELLRGPLAEAKVVGLDVLFPEPDEAAHGVSPDDLFAVVMKAHGRVVLAAHWSGESSEPDRDLLERIAYPAPQARVDPWEEGTSLALPTPTLAQAAAAIGYVDITPDADGVYRRFRPFATGRGNMVHPHFGLAIAQIAAGVEPGSITGELARGAYRLPLDRPKPLRIGRDDSTLINYCGPTGTIRRVSFSDALTDPNARDTFRDKIVLVGATAPGLYDIRPAPYRQSNRVFFGVETNANIVNSILHREPLVDAGGSYLWAGLAVLLGALVSLSVWMVGAAALAVIGSAAMVTVLAAPSFFVAFSTLHQTIPYGAVLLAAVVPFVIGVYERLTVERRLIQRQFDAYVSPDVLKELMGSPEVLRDSRRREVTLLFADVRGSTTLSESIAPEVWIAQLNEYLTQMSLAIFAFDGYLDKFMGDGIMAVWNAFGTQDEDHAKLAVQAGRQMLARLELLNKKWANTPDRTPFRIGIGIHTGPAVMGNVGSEERTQFTAIGDTVNTASRIEGLCKQYKSEFIISQTTAERLDGSIELRELGDAEIRGRAGTIKIFDVVVPSVPRTHPKEDADGPVRQEEEGC